LRSLKGSSNPSDDGGKTYEQEFLVFVALGDSLTVGFQSPSPMAPNGVETPYTQWLEKMVREKLRDMGRNVNAFIVNAGINGDSTDGMNWRFAQDVAAEKPNFVIVWAGLNDLFAGRSPSKVFERIAELYERCHGIDASPIGCALTPVEEPDQVNEAIVALNELIKGHCQDEGIHFVDLYGATTDASGRLRRELSNDSAHLTTEGYRLVAEIIYKDAVEEILVSLQENREQDWDAKPL
jgi:lysophospholipase L1-like esterase